MSNRSGNPITRLIVAVHRRSLWQVLGIYVVASWAVLGGVGTLGDALGLPDWFPRLALGVLIVGLPFALATAFVQSGRPEHELGDDRADGAPATRLSTRPETLRVGVTATGRSGEAAPDASIHPSIAVLPFSDLSPARDQQYFVEGLSEEIINALAQISGLKVTARTSAFAFRGTDLDVPTIAGRLGVATVLEGSVRRDGNRIRVTVQLIEAETGFHIWSDNFDRELTAIFAIQDEISRSIAARLQLTLTGKQAEALVEARTASAPAHDAYLLGRSLGNQRTFEGLTGAVTQFERAIALDPEYADAYSGLADAYALMELYPLGATVPLDYRALAARALAAARRAVDLAPESGMAHSSLGLALGSGGRWEESRREFEEAVELSPGYAPAYVGLAQSNPGLVDLPWLRRVLELDPRSITIRSGLFLWLRKAGQLDDAIAEARRCVELDPRWPNGWIMLGLGLLDARRVEEADEAFAEHNEFTSWGEETYRELARARVRFLETGEPDPTPTAVTPDSPSPALILLAYMRGQADALYTLLSAAAEAGAYRTVVTTATLAYDIVDDDPRFERLLREVGPEQ